MRLRALLFAAALPAALLSASGGSAQDAPIERWEAANRAYRAGEFGRAIEIYDDLVRTHADAHLEANLAAALWRRGDRGAAMVHYLRARALSPRDPAVRADLAALRTALGDPPVPETSLRALTQWVRRDELLMLLLVLNAATAAAIALGRRRLATAAGGGALLAAGLTLLHASHEGRNVAIALGDLDLHGRPDGVAIGRLPEGAAVSVLESRDGMARVRTAGLPAGWVDSGLIARLHSDADDRTGR